MYNVYNRSTVYVIKFIVYNKSIMCNKSTLSIIKVQCIK